jgi:hypothetical protein
VQLDEGVFQLQGEIRLDCLRGRKLQTMRKMFKTNLMEDPDLEAGSCDAGASNMY